MVEMVDTYDKLEYVPDDFGRWLVLQGRKESTIKKHLVRLGAINRSVCVWTHKSVMDFIVEKRVKGCANKTINSYLDTIRLYYKYLGVTPPDIKYLKCVTKIKGVLTNDEVAELINLPCPEKCDKKIWDRWSLFFKCLALTGARPGEIANLKNENIDLGTMTFYFEDTKTLSPRKCPIPNSAQKSIREAYRASQGYIFVTLRGKKFSHRSWMHAFDKRLKLLNIDRPNITLYSLRHSFITSLINEDVSIFKIAKLVGHDPSQTRTYTHLTTEDTKRAMNRHPLNRNALEPKEFIELFKTLIDNISYPNFIEKRVSHDGNSISVVIKVKGQP